MNNYAQNWIRLGSLALGVGQGERPAAVALQDGTGEVHAARHGHRAEGLDQALPEQIISRPDIREGYAQ